MTKDFDIAYCFGFIWKYGTQVSLIAQIHPNKIILYKLKMVIRFIFKAPLYLHSYIFFLDPESALLDTHTRFQQLTWEHIRHMITE